MISRGLFASRFTQLAPVRLRLDPSGGVRARSVSTRDSTRYVSDVPRADGLRGRAALLWEPVGRQASSLRGELVYLPGHACWAMVVV